MTSRQLIDRAARIVRAGGVIAYPTEAVFGIGCLPLDRAAVARVIALKRRSARKGLLLIAADVAMLEPFVILPPEPARAEILADWPGPVTWVLPARAHVPAELTGGRDTLAVRVTSHEIAARLAARVGAPLVSTSANLSGRPPLRTALGVRRALGRAIDYVLPGAVGGLARPTVIKDARTRRILRA